jgi:hypothetical protein
MESVLRINCFVAFPPCWCSLFPVHTQRVFAERIGALYYEQLIRADIV